MLDELVDTIETLKARISEHATVLRASEAQTRLSLIDPLLRALGWDTADPALVRPEYILSGGRADYALLGADEKPVAVMEAKRLNEPLGTTDRQMQMLTYANFSGVSFAGLTDGDKWVLYRVFDQRPLADRLVLDISIADSPAYESALKLLLLWRPNLASGQPIEAGEPILNLQAPPPVTADPAPTPMAPPISPPPTPSGTVVPKADWITLEDYRPPVDRRAPQKLSFPDGAERPIRFKKQIVIEVSEWLIREGVLGPEACPLTAGRDSGYSTVNRTPSHPNGDGFKSVHQLSNGLYLDANFGLKGAVSVCRAIVTERGKDPATVHVQVR